MTYPSDTERYARHADPDTDSAYRSDTLTYRRGPSAVWIVAGLIILVAILAIWGGAFDTGPATNTATPPAVESPTTPPTPTPSPAPAQ